MYHVLTVLLICLCLSMGSKPSVELQPIVVTPSSDYLTVKKCTNCSEKEWKFIQESQAKTNETITSTCFASFMLSRKLIQTNDLSNKEVLDSLVGKNTEIDVEMYWTVKHVLGYTLPKANKEWINRRYMMKWNKCDLASLLGHETSHKKGYDHAFYSTATRQYSVPYSINAAFEQCCVR